MGYGIYFLTTSTRMLTDCSDLVNFFFFNEVAVGTLTFIQCVALLICFRKSKQEQGGPLHEGQQHVSSGNKYTEEAAKALSDYKKRLEAQHLSLGGRSGS